MCSPSVLLFLCLLTLNQESWLEDQDSGFRNRAIKHSLTTRQLILGYTGSTKMHKRIGTQPCTLRQPWVSVTQFNSLFHSFFNSTTFQCIFVLQFRGHIPKRMENYGTNWSLLSTRIRTLSTGLENNNTLKCWSSTFLTTLVYAVMLENFRSAISMYCCSPI